MLKCVEAPTCELIAICPDCDLVIDIDRFMTTGDRPLTLVENGVTTKALPVDDMVWITQTEPPVETWAKRPLWHNRQTVYDLAERHQIDHETAAEMYRERGE